MARFVTWDRGVAAVDKIVDIDIGVDPHGNPFFTIRYCDGRDRRISEKDYAEKIVEGMVECSNIQGANADDLRRGVEEVFGD